MKNPKLYCELLYFADMFDGVLSDKFAKTLINQAHALSVCLNTPYIK